MFRSIFRRLIFTDIAILLVFVVIVSVSFGWFFDSYVTRSQEGQVFNVSGEIERMTGAFQIEETDIRARNAYKQSLITWSRFIHADIIVTNTDGEVSASSCSIDKVPKEYVDKVLSQENEDSSSFVKETGNFDGQYDESVLTIGLPVHYGGNVVGVMFFNSYMPKMRKTIVEILRMLLFAALFAMLVALVLVYIQSRRISKPIKQINDAAQDIASGKFSERVRVTSKDEIGQLASSFNFMADSLADLEKQRSGFVSDVSHELRTPMTSISGFAEGMLDGTIPTEKRDYYIKVILDESRRLTKLTNDLLEMSKMSSSEYRLDITKFDINELIRISIIGMGSKIDEKNLEMNIDFKKENIFVLADKDAITRVVINLLDNAVKFSYENTTITVKTYTEGKRAYISVGNYGAGIDGKDLSKVFNRFYKSDKSRTNEKSGAGLGLSFVKNILTLHKQSIWVESVAAKEGTGVKYTSFTFTLEEA